MNCPECKKEFSLTRHDYFSNLKGIHRCPNCHFVGKLKHLSKLDHIFHLISMVAIFFSTCGLLEFILSKYVQLEFPLGLLFGFPLGLALVFCFDFYHDNNKKKLKKNVGVLPNKQLGLLITSSVFALIIFGTPVFVLWLIINRDYENPEKLISQFNQAEIEKLSPYRKAILADLKLLVDQPLFGKLENTKNKDASILLNQKISWNKQDKLIRLLWKRNKVWWKNKESLIQLRKSADELKIDTTWVEDLHQFDHWKVEGHPFYQIELGKVSQLSGEERMKVFQNLPAPRLNDLSMLVLINFLRMHQRQQTLQGLKTMRKVAELYYSQQTVAGNINVTHLLSKEYLLTEKFAIKNWPLLSHSGIEAFRRASYSTRQLFQYAWFQDFPADFEVYLSQQTGMCASGVEMLVHLVEYQDLLKPHFFFETNLSGHFEKNLQFQKKLLKVCGKEEYAEFLKDTPPDSDPWFKAEKEPWYTVDEGEEPAVKYSLSLSKIPYLRKRLGLTSLTSVNYNYLKPYVKLIP